MTKREEVEGIFIQHGLPGWLGWGTMGAESSYGATSSGHYFGLIMPSYDGVAPNNNWKEDAQISATLYAKLVQQYGSIEAAVPHYSGNSYTVAHVESFGKVPGKKFVVGKSGKFSGEKDLGAKGGLLATVPGAETAANAVSGAVSPLGGIAEMFGKLFDVSTWVRIGKALGGFLLLAFGATTLMKVLTGVEIPTGAAKAASLAKGFLA